MSIPLEILVHKCDTIMPRYYTIASSAAVSPNQVRIAISLSTFDTPTEKFRKGLVSLWCQRLAKDPNLKTRLFAKDSFFVLQDKPSLMIGPGTGVVPFIAFAEEREHKKQSQEAHLFFGCRDKDTDFIYRDFLARMTDQKVFTSLNLAFSRPRDGSEKAYV